MVHAAEEAQACRRVDAAHVRDAVLAVRREDVVLGGERAAGADLRGLLALRLREQAELALALERRRLVVEAAREHHVAVETAQRRGVEVGDALAVAVGLRGRDAGAGGRHELEQGCVVGAARDVGEVGVRARSVPHAGSRVVLGHATLLRCGPAVRPARSGAGGAR
ncbi:Uncharacterised protein [Mycobacteroides abscessus]|nr:Uncharacterised protein [Mycobacteroides abscessus]